MNRLSFLSCALTMAVPAELQEVGPTLGQAAELSITSRKAMTLIGRAIPGSHGSDWRQSHHIRWQRWHLEVSRSVLINLQRSSSGIHEIGTLQCWCKFIK